MIRTDESRAAIEVVRRNTFEVQGGGDFDVFDELFADHTPQPGVTADKAGVRVLYTALRAAFAEFHAVIHWQSAEGGLVTTFKTYHGTHRGEFLGIAATGRPMSFETVDAMRVVDGRIVAHWGVGNLLSVVRQLGGLPSVDISTEPPAGVPADSPSGATEGRPTR
jgi:predicted ester cyclase